MEDRWVSRPSRSSSGEHTIDLKPETFLDHEDFYSQDYNDNAHLDFLEYGFALCPTQSN